MRLNKWTNKFIWKIKGESGPTIKVQNVSFEHNEQYQLQSKGQKIILLIKQYFA